MEKITRNNIFDREKEYFYSKRMVIKIGSSTVFDQQAGINTAFIDSMADQVARLRRNGTEVLFVCSGSVAVGRKSDRERNIAAALGQAKLTTSWTGVFEKHGLDVLQFLFSQGDLEDKEELEDLLRGAMSEGVVIVNGNDAVHRKDRTGHKSLIENNDYFAGFIADTVGSDTLLLLTDVMGVLDEEQMLIPSVTRLEDVNEVLDGKSVIGTGGMMTKCQAASMFVNSGNNGFSNNKRAYISSGGGENVLLNAAKGINVGTGFTQKPMLY